jgi:hypothetical protein
MEANQQCRLESLCSERMKPIQAFHLAWLSRPTKSYYQVLESDRRFQAYLASVEISVDENNGIRIESAGGFEALNVHLTNNVRHCRKGCAHSPVNIDIECRSTTHSFFDYYFGFVCFW